MIKNFKIFENKNTEFIPLNIRKKYDVGFKDGKYKNKDINFIFEYIGHRIEHYTMSDWYIKKEPNMTFAKNIHNYFDKNEKYLEYMKNILINKKVGYYSCGDTIEPNYYYVIPVVKRVEFNTYGTIVVSGNGGFLGGNNGIGADYGGAIDERMPIKIINSKIIMSKEDPYGEEDWSI